MHQDGPNPTPSDPGRNAGSGPLRLSRRFAGDRPEATDGPFAIERLTTLTHELNNLLDGSLRCLSLARRSLTAGRVAAHSTHHATELLDTVYAALERMADLVHAAMRGSASVVGSPTITPAQPITIGEALRHAADVVTPEAEEHDTRIAVTVRPEAEHLPAGPLYSVVLNAFRNALESIQRARAKSPGPGHILAALGLQPMGDHRGGGIDLLVLEIADDGAGISPGAEAAQAFDFGWTSKPGGLGVGLALSREIVREVGGTIELLPHPSAPAGPRPGAVLRIVYPIVRKR
jgi:signal transduction histidine kinase